MAIGPFNTYSKPNVYTQTTNDPTGVGLPGGLRLPTFIGVGQEYKSVVDYEIARGSSAVADTQIINEDISSQFTGTNANFTVANIPVVVPNGLGQTTFNGNDLKVTVDNFPVSVIQFNGETGVGVLDSIPPAGSTVLVSYYYNRTDTLITKEDLTYQVDGTRTAFEVENWPIVDGSDGGVITTDVTKVIAYVNNIAVTVSSLDGANGLITLASAPVVGSTLTVTYYINSWQDTSDPLPAKDVSQIIRVGYAPGRTDYIEGIDFVVENDAIQWGASWSKTNGFTAIGSSPLSTTQLQGLLVDYHIYAEEATGTVNGTNKTFTIKYIPTTGSGRSITTNNPTDISVYVGTDVQAALSAGAVQVFKLDGTNREVTLLTAPTVGEFVYVTYYASMLTDDTYTLKVTAVGGAGVGTYQLSSLVNGYVATGVVNKPACVVADAADFALEGVTFPSSLPDIVCVPGVAIDESITLTFTSGGMDYIVSSNQPTGSSGTGSLNQTYIDNRTGIRFTIMQGTTVVYQAGDTLQIDVTTNPVIDTGAVPTLAIPGFRLTVSDTLNTALNNTALVKTYNKSGSEPAVGSIYYVTFNYMKAELPKAIYTSFVDVVNEFGPLNTANKLTLAASLAFQNGAVAIGLVQVPKGADGIQATTQSFKDAIVDLHEPFPGGIKPRFIVPLTTDQEVIAYATQDAEIQSTIRYANERVVFAGYAITTTPEEAQAFTKEIRSERLDMVYPGGGVIGITDELGNEVESVVDGSLLAAAYAAMALQPAYDPAVPLTNKRIVGFKRLIRTINNVVADQTAVAGNTIIEALTEGLLNVRDALTTNTSTVLTRIPSVIEVKDYVQVVMRDGLQQFIGIKFLESTQTDVVNTMTAIANGLVSQQIIRSFTGVSCKANAQDVTILDVQAAYIPIFPLQYIVIKFSIRTN